MSDWVTVAAVDEIVPGAFRVVDLDGTRVAVFNIDGNYYAIEDVCTRGQFRRPAGLGASSVRGDRRFFGTR